MFSRETKKQWAIIAIIVAILFLVFPLLRGLLPFAHGQLHHHHHATDAPTGPPGTVLGDWGFRHGELHEKGVVHELMRRTGTSCCDGVHSGECRASVVRVAENGRLEVFLNRMWCPVNKSREQIFQDIELPKGITAAVCAGRGGNGLCPSVYCIAIQAQM